MGLFLFTLHLTHSLTSLFLLKLGSFLYGLVNISLRGSLIRENVVKLKANLKVIFGIIDLFYIIKKQEQGK